MRAWAWTAAAALAVAGCKHPIDPSDGGDPQPVVQYTRSAASNPIVDENAKPGDGDWYIHQEANNREIEGYASDVSVEAGGTLDVMVSTSTAADFTYDVFRLGYYGGDGARKLASGGPFHGAKQADCPADPTTELVECSWPAAFTLNIGADWVSGMYFIRLHRDDGFERYVPFILRDHRAAEVLFKAGVDTDEAYNRWGGESLYYDSSHRSPSGMGFKVSFDRPYDDGAGAYSMLWWDQHAVRWLERNGYDVTYGTNVDANRFDGFYDGIGAIVTAGHDEYWSQRERDVINGVLADGNTSIVNMTANPAYWRIRFESDSAGHPWRNIVCYKAKQSLDPLGAGADTTTARFRDDPNAQPENAVFGTMYEDWALMGFPLVIGDTSNPLFANTGFQSGDTVPSLVGYEYDRRFANGAEPAGEAVLATSPILNAEEWPSTSEVVVRTTPQGRTVFSAGSIYWPLALSADPDRQDVRIWKLTWNVMEQALSHRHTPRPAPDFEGVTRADPPAVPRWATVIAAFAGQAGLHKVADGPASQAGFQSPTGIAVDEHGTVYVSDSTANQIRMVKNGQVTTIAGDGQPGTIDGPGAQARFRVPAGLAIGPDKALYVADSDGMLIRRIDLADGQFTVSTFAGKNDRYGGYQDGPASQAYFYRPVALAFGLKGELYVVDQQNSLIRVIGTGPNPTVETIAGTQAIFGAQDGPGDTATLRGQLGILWMPSGVLFADASSNRIRQLLDGADAHSSQITTFAGSGRGDATLSTPEQSSIWAPAGLAVGPDGRVYVTDTGNGVIRVLTP